MFGKIFILENYKFVELWLTAKLSLYWKYKEFVNSNFFHSAIACDKRKFSHFYSIVTTLVFSLTCDGGGLSTFSECLVLTCQGCTDKTWYEANIDTKQCTCIVLPCGHVCLFMKFCLCIKSLGSWKKKFAIIRGVFVYLDEYRWFWCCLLCGARTENLFALNSNIIIGQQWTLWQYLIFFPGNMDIVTESHWPLLTLLSCFDIMFYV